MTDIGDLTQHVEANPNDHNQRWHLAKKLYMAGEYRLALGHLLVLQTNWTPKVNVLRYLGATYYRLGRLDEAIAELGAGIEEWPEEIGLREQLARVLESAGREPEAQKVWREILKIQPDHGMAQHELAKSNRSAESAASQHALHQPFQGSLCPNCGAENGDEFDRCWKCHASLREPGAPDAFLPPGTEPPLSPSSRKLPWNLVCMMAMAGCIGFGAYLTIIQYIELRAAIASKAVPATVQEVFATTLLPTRMILAGILLAAWPAALWFAAKLINARPSGQSITVSGLLMASAFYLVSWAHPSELLVLYAVLQAAALVPIFLTMRQGAARSVVLWVIQAIVVSGVIVGAIAGLEGTVFVSEFRAIAGYAGAYDDAQRNGVDIGRAVMADVRLPIECTLRWDSTGSTWLDSRASQAAFEVASSGLPPGLTVELKDETGTLFYEHPEAMPFKFAFDNVVAGQNYRLAISGQEGAQIEVSVHGIMRARFTT